jgi:hypothetical protein
MSVIYPVKIPDPKDMSGPIIFFGGPDKGGGDWRPKAYELFAEHFGDNFCAAMPCLYDDGHPFAKLRLPSVWRHPERPRSYTKLDWVEYYADLAAIHSPKGCAIYWLPAESATKPRSDGKPYAMNTRDEVGFLRGRIMYDRNGIRYVLGIDPEFPGRKAIVANYKKRLRHFDVYDSLEETVKSAVKRMEQDNWAY